MIGEAILAIKALDTAFVTVQGLIAKKKDVEDMAGEVGKFFTAKKKVEEHIANARKAGTDDLMTGSALEEAITIDQQEERIEKMMEKIRDHYMKKGQTHRWAKIKQQAAIIEKKREVKRKANAAARLAANQEEEMLIHDLAKLFLYLVGTIIVIAGVVFLIFGSGAE
jgi:Fe2+ transport system protein B|tara:strand:+ start:48 stop:548 length:501 start_codon:yes stop_codon:yes gene_type:complete